MAVETGGLQLNGSLPTNRVTGDLQCDRQVVGLHIMIDLQN